ncbi:MAG: hypothetical protein ACRC7N_10980 [Clostridium sp.]
MKKTPILILAFLFTFSLTCISVMNFQSIKNFITSGFQSIEEKIDEVSKNTSSNDTKLPTSENTNDKDIAEEKPLDTTISFSKYLPNKKEMSIFSIGDYKYGSSIDTVQYISNDKIQILTVSGSRIQRVYKLTTEGLYIVNEQELKDSDSPTNIINSKETLNKLVIKAPLSIGTKWSNDSGDSFEITSIDKICTTKAGNFNSIEITKIQKSTKNITKDYFGEGAGLIKSVTRDTGNNIIYLTQADKIEN